MFTGEVAKRLKESSDWQLLKAHIEETIDSLNTLDDIDALEPTGTAIEVRARQLAKEKLLLVLEPFIFSEHENTDSKEEARKKHGL